VSFGLGCEPPSSACKHVATHYVEHLKKWMICKQQIKSDQISIYFTGYIKELPVDEEQNTIKYVFQNKR
jgi:hypothetical protein